jgi:hypothetical protein
MGAVHCPEHLCDRYVLRHDEDTILKNSHLPHYKIETVLFVYIPQFRMIAPSGALPVFILQPLEKTSTKN